MIEVVAAGVIDGKIVTDCSCIVPASARRCSVGKRPVRIAGQTTRGVAASITTRRTRAFIDGSLSSTAVDIFARADSPPGSQILHRKGSDPGSDPFPALAHSWRYLRPDPVGGAAD